MFRNKYIL